MNVSSAIKTPSYFSALIEKSFEAQNSFNKINTKLPYSVLPYL